MENIYIAIIAALSFIILLILIWLAMLSRRVRKMQLIKDDINKALSENRIDEAVKIFQEDLNSSKKQIDNQRVRLRTLEDSLVETFSKIGLYRFDAFNDIGGELSFAVAILNEKGDGAIISVINGRQESRTYAKTIKQGKASHPLSDEEKKAVVQALKG